MRTPRRCSTRAVKCDDRTACGRGGRRRRTVRADRGGGTGTRRRRRCPCHRTRSRNRWNPPPQRPSRLRHARSQALHVRALVCQAAHRDGAGRRRGVGDRGDGHRLGRCTRAADHLTAWSAERHRRCGGAGHRSAGAAASRPTRARRPARRGVHHRAVAESRASARGAGGQPCGDRRRRAGQLVGGVDAARIRLRHSRNGQRLSARGVLRGVSTPRPCADGRTGVHTQPAGAASTARTACAAP